MSEEFMPPTTFPALYETRGGGIARIECKATTGVFLGYRPGEEVTDWYENGRWLDYAPSDDDLIGAPLPDAEIEAQQERALSAAVEALKEARQHGAPWAAQDTADQIRRAKT